MNLPFQPYKEHQNPRPYATWASVLVPTARGLRNGLEVDVVWASNWLGRPLLASYGGGKGGGRPGPSLRCSPRPWGMLLFGPGVSRVIKHCWAADEPNVVLWWACTLKQNCIFNQLETCTCGTKWVVPKVTKQMCKRAHLIFNFHGRIYRCRILIMLIKKFHIQLTLC